MPSLKREGSLRVVRVPGGDVWTESGCEVETFLYHGGGSELEERWLEEADDFRRCEPDFVGGCASV